MKVNTKKYIIIVRHCAKFHETFNFPFKIYEQTHDFQKYEM